MHHPENNIEKLGAEEKNTEQDSADSLVNEDARQHRNGGSPSKGSADSEIMLERITTIQTPEVMEVTESCSQRFSQSDPTTASVSDQQTWTPTVQDRVCAFSLVDSTSNNDPQGFCEQSTSENEIVHTSLTYLEYELPQTTLCNSAVIRPEKANHKILPNSSNTSTSHWIKGQKTVPSNVGEIDLHQNSNSNTDDQVSNQNLQSKASKEDHQSTSTAPPFSPVIISVESLANASKEDSPPLHQSVALPASSMEVLVNSKPIMFLVKNRHNNTRIATQSTGNKDEEPGNPESVQQETEQRPNIGFSSTANNIQGHEELRGSCPVVDPSDSSDPGYRSAEASHQHSPPVNYPQTCKTTVWLEYGTKKPSKYTDTKSKKVKEKESEGTFEKKRDSIKKPDRFCVYCQKIVKGGKLSSHISHAHKLEPEVQAILKKPLATRVKFFIAKRREGIYQYNLLSINGNKNQPLMRERKTLHSDDPIKVCTDCKGFFSKTCFFRHKCVSDDVSRESRRLIEIFTENMEEDSEFQNILSLFVQGEIDEFCRSNNLIKTIAYQYYNTRRRKRGKEEEARQTTIRDMRELSRLFFQFRIICATGKAVEDMFDRDNMKDLMEAMKLLEALTESSQSLETGSSLHNVVLRSVKSLEDFYTHTMQFKMKKELRKFKLAYTKINPKAITKKADRRKEFGDLSEPSCETTVEAEIGEGNSVPDLVTKETSTEQGTCSDTSMKKSGKKLVNETVSESESNNTSCRRSARVQEASTDCPSDDTSNRKSARKPVSKPFLDEMNDSAKKIRLDNVDSEAKAVTMKTRSCSVKWSSEETQLLRRHFQSYIYIHNDKDDNTGNLPGKKVVLAFLKTHPIGCIKELNEKTQIQKIRTKIFNERKTSRERGRKKLREMEATKLTLI